VVCGRPRRGFVTFAVAIDTLLTCVIGVTVGCVVIPQSMAYAKLAQLPVEFGLYSSFMGVIIYWFFATSKDITIGVRITSGLLGLHLLTRHSLSQSYHKSLAPW
jgi:MFS superfamily sulfate permease-like transporter